jgi:5-(carboxyamino)imidazole ribonucleotide synthase
MTSTPRALVEEAGVCATVRGELRRWMRRKGTMALTLGIVGGGQLARMMIARRWSSASVRVSPKKRMSAALAATAVGDYRDLDTVRAFARDVDVVTFDHEHVPQDVLRALVADGIRVHPGPDALQFAQDKLAMRARLAELGMPQPEWAAVTDAAELQASSTPTAGAWSSRRREAATTARVRVVSDPAEVADWFDGGALLAEELVDFSRELAQQVARRPSGELRAYPVVETVQRDGVCAEVVAPARAAALTEVAASIGTASPKGWA